MGGNTADRHGNKDDSIIHLVIYNDSKSLI